MHISAKMASRKGCNLLRRSLVFCLMMIISAPLQLAIADADEQRWEDDDNSYDQARRALSRGDVLPIEEILKHLKSRVPGQVLEAEFEREGTRWVYEFKMIDETGRRLEVYLDAKTGDLISVEGR